MDEGEQQGRRRSAKPSWRGSTRGRWRGSAAPFLEAGDEGVLQIGVVVGEEQQHVGGSEVNSSKVRRRRSAAAGT